MAYAVVKSLKETTDGLVRDHSGHICINANSSTYILESVWKELNSLEKILNLLNKSSSMSRSSSRSRNINRERVNALDGQIREALCDFEDILDFHVSHQFDSQIQAGDGEMIHPLSFTLDFEQLTQQFDSFMLKLKMIKEEYIIELCPKDDFEEEEDPKEEDEDDDDDGDDDHYPHRNHEEEEEEKYFNDDDYYLEEEEKEEEYFDEEEEAEQFLNVVLTDHHFRDDDESYSDHNMVGLSDTFTELKDLITEDDDELSRSKWKLTSITGMAGVGKTAIAKKLFRDPQIATLFQRRAFVTIGPKYRLKFVLLDILNKVNPEKAPLTTLDVKRKSAALLKRMVYRSLQHRSCFIVLDDVWHKTIWNELKPSFPRTLYNHWQVLLTSRLIKVALLASPSATYHIRFLNKKESWHLLRNKVFGGDQESSCPPQLIKAGEKIAENCDGLPLTILKVANILSRAGKTPEYWNEVAGKKQHPLFFDAYEQMFDVLYKSYDYLPQELRPFFLYIGVFPQNYEIPCSELTNLWSGEGLYTGQYMVVCFLIKLHYRNLVLLHKEGYYSCSTKRVRLHSVFWYMCNKEARKNKFFYCLNTCADTLAQDMKSQRRLCIQNNVLFGIKDVRDLISSVSTVRSLLCTGTYHPYPVPICLDLRLLRVLHALTIRFYEFPMEVLNRVKLQYFALTLDANLPSSISKLWNLRYLIVRRHVRIVKSRGSSSYLPMEIWGMKELGHLQVMGSDLPNLNCEDDHILYNLVVLLGVSARSCTKDVFKRIPCLYKLGVQIELGPDDDEPLCFFDDISHIHYLEMFKCVVATPKIVSGVVAPPAPLSIFSSSLRKLTLSGTGYPWEEMTKISSLPNLKVLKLRCYAFRGPQWVVDEKEFPKLESLFIEDTDLVKWKSHKDYYCLENLECLNIKHCYKLQEIPITLFGKSLQQIDLVDCNPLAHTCAEQLNDHLNKQYPRELPVDFSISSSWGDRK